jgi:splicing factor 3B subunit 1
LNFTRVEGREILSNLSKAAGLAHYRQVVKTVVELAQKAGVSEIVGRIVNELKDEAEPYRKMSMVMETITKVVATLGASDID